MTLDEFRKAFAELKSKGWVKSLRRGPTGVGYTLEKLLGLRENNVALPDLGEIELKAHRINSPSMVTLFTFNKQAWKIPPLEAIQRYGIVDQRGRRSLYCTVSRSPNSFELFLHVGNDTVSIRHVSGVVITEWDLQALCQQFMQKIPALILVSAQSEDRGGEEWIKFDRAQLLQKTSEDILRTQIEIGNVLVDLRLHQAKNHARNHGTAFRVPRDKLPSLFRIVQDL